MATVVAYRRACLDNGAHQGGSEAGSEAKGRGWQSECAQQLNLLMSLYERNKVFYEMKRL